MNHQITRTKSRRPTYQVHSQNLIQALIYKMYIGWSHRRISGEVVSKNEDKITGGKPSLLVRMFGKILRVTKRSFIGLIKYSWYKLQNLQLFSIVKFSAAVVVILGFTYGYLVNQTVAVTSDYSDLEERLSIANQRLSDASARVAATESSIDNHQQVLESVQGEQVEPSGFVSRDVSNNFTASNSVES